MKVKSKKQKVSVSVIPFQDDILGVVDGFVFIKTMDCVVKIPRKEYLRILNLWLDAKESYCKRWNHFCGVMGDIGTDNGEQIGEIDILNEDSIDDDENAPAYKNVPLILAEKFNNLVDMEHG